MLLHCQKEQMLLTVNELTSGKQLDSSPSSAYVISSGIDDRIGQLEELVEERTNRQLRKGIVIKGISDSDQEKTWYDVEKRLSHVFSETLDISP